MQLARRISLLVAFSLLASAATAHPECAWVLWRHDRCDYTKLERLEVYDSLAQSEDVARGELELMHRSPGATAIVHKGALGRLTVQSDVFAYECWPRHRGPARAEDEISKLVFYERLIFSGSLTGAALARE